MHGKDSKRACCMWMSTRRCIEINGKARLWSSTRREVDLTVATTRLIAGGIFDRFPTLKIVLAHFGGGIAAVKERLVGKGYRFGTLKKPFGDYFASVYRYGWV